MISDSVIFGSQVGSLVRAEDRVRKLLEEDEFFRGNDVALCFEFWRRFEGLSRLDIFDKECVSVLTPPETISRARRKIQHDEGLYLPDEEIVEAREIRQEATKEWSIKK